MTSNPLIRVLIADDAANVRQDLRMVLSMARDAAGIPLEIVGEAANGEEAIRQVEALRPEVVLLDLAMPGIDGWEAARRIKAAGAGISVIALTVYGDIESREKACRAGVDEFIIKGEPVDKILAAIGACAKRSRGFPVENPENR